MWDWIILGLGVLFLVGVLLWAVLLFSMRAKYQPVLGRIRRLNRAFWNPRAMKTAGSAGATYSSIHHVGRRSGKEYRTPVGVVETPRGLVIALPYGDSADWVKNVLSAGSAVVVHEGETRLVERPQIVAAPLVDEHLSARARVVNRLYGVREFLVLDSIEDRDRSVA